jgi:tetratricopeptide (TPR) repeat protein
VRRNQRSATARALIALAAVLVVKAVVFFQIGHHPLLAPAGELDGGYYYHFAQRVAAGDVWLLRADSFFGHRPPAFFIAPLYIYFLALCLKIGAGSLDAARAVQIILGTAAVALLAATARRWYGNRAAWWTGALAALCGVFTFHEVIILQASIEPFLTALDLYLLTRALQSGRPLSWAAAGAALGLHALNRPNLLIVLVGIAAMAPFAMKGLKAKAGAAAAFVLAALVVIAPATVRNWRAAGEFVPIASHGGLNFLIGNGPQADGTFARVLDIPPTVTGQWLGAAKVVRDALGREPTSGDVSRFFLRQSLDWMRAHPGSELALLARKSWYAISATFLTLNHSYPFFAYDLHTLLAVLFVGPAILLPLGVVGLTIARPRQPPGFWLVAAYVPLAIGSVVVFFVAARYRLPFQVAAAVPAGGAIAWALDRLRRAEPKPETWRQLPVAAALAAAVAAIVVWPTGLDDGRVEEQASEGLLAIQSGLIPEGEAWINRALIRHPTPGVVHARAGQIYESMNRTSEALAHYREAVRIDPTEPSTHFVLGRALVRAGQDQEALVELTRAIPGPQEDSATRLQVLALSRLDRRDEADRVMGSLDPRRWDAEQARAFAGALMEAGRVDLSTIAWRRAAEASGDGGDYEQLGLAFGRLQRDAEAAGALAEAVRRRPTSASAHLNYGVALAAQGRLDEARREAATALQLEPNYDLASRFLAAIARR